MEILEQTIRNLKEQPVPNCPENLETIVLRRIRTEREPQPEENLIDWISGLIPNTGFALSAIALVIAVSTLTTITTTLLMSYDRKFEINKALGFDTITVTKVVHLEGY